MSTLYQKFATNKDLEKSGIVLQYGTTIRDGKEVPVTITIGRAGGGNVRFEKVFEAKTKPYKRMIQTDTLDPKVAERLMIETYAETVVLGWENVQDSEGNFLEFKPENVVIILTDLPDLFSDIQSQATKMALFRTEINEVDTKN